MKSLLLPFTTLLAFTFVLTFSSCEKTSGNGNIITKEFDTDIFFSVEMASAGNVKIIQSNEYKVIASGDKHVIDNINYRNESGRLILDLEPGNYNGYILSYQVFTPDISALTVSGSGTMEARDFDSQTSLYTLVSGSGNLKLINFQGERLLFAEISGSGNIYAHQDYKSFNELRVQITGSGNYEGFSLLTDSARVVMTNSGKAEVNALKKLDAIITGSGNIYYKGAPSIKFQDYGSGKIINAN